MEIKNFKLLSFFQLIVLFLKKNYFLTKLINVRKSYFSILNSKRLSRDMLEKFKSKCYTFFSTKFA